MDIQQQNIDKLQAVLKIKLSKEDYSASYDQALKNYRKQVKMPGFRPGHVPMGMVKKMYGKSILADELNKLINEAIHQHITDKKLNVLGNPLPKENGQTEGNWEQPGDFEFEYELGLAPEFEISLSKKQKFTLNKVKIDDKMIDEQVMDMAKRFGSMSQPTESEATDMLMGTFVQLDGNDEILAGGVMHDGTISIEFVEDKKTQKSLIGVHIGDHLILDPHKISKGHDDMGRMLGITHEEVHHWTGNVRFTINEMRRLAAAPVDQALFDKVFGKDNITDEKAFRARVAEDLSKMFEKDSERLLKKEISDKLVADTKITLPDAFLKRWIRAANEKPVTPEQIEADYPNYAKGLQWQLIENKLIKDHNVKVEPKEVIDHAKSLIAAQYAQYGLPLDDAQLESFARNSMSNQEEAQRMYENLYQERVLDVCKELVEVKEKSVSYDDFVKLFS